MGSFSGSSGAVVWEGGAGELSVSSGGAGESVAVVWAPEVCVGAVPAPVSAGRGVVVGESGVVVGDCVVVVPAPGRVSTGSMIWFAGVSATGGGPVWNKVHCSNSPSPG